MSPAKIESLLSYTLTIAAVAIAATLVQQTFFPRRGALSARIVAGPPKFIANWRDVVRNGVVIGDSAAPVKVIEFADLECPFCKRFQETTYPPIRSRYGDRVALVFVHYPLTMHRFAVISARAAECASTQGRFAQFVNLVYAKQDSLGLKSWGSYGHEAGVSDTVAFSRCVEGDADVARIDSGKAIAARLGILGTPGIMVNGWLFPQPPSDSVLEHTVQSLLVGRAPFRE